MDLINSVVKTADHYVPLRKLNIWANPTQPQAQILDMSPVTRLAGLSGAIAISLGAYGSHVLRDNPEIESRRRMAFDTASRYHMIHSLALLAAHRARFPILTTGLLTTGIILFCGPCYHYSITGQEETRKFTPIGGVTLILAWLSFIL
ncbi:unnamed protein product [Caenorhabditis angaria]|uniref:Transmembrane protein 256 homolog n=1 Tax=Caenorhabditis angaria TaxID=860376 RepID=A0A9P1I574_9PELO|nr:unnamed protein product [Caenorhabditis angaria]